MHEQIRKNAQKFLTIKSKIMKRLLPLVLIIAGSIFAPSAYSQIRINAHVSLPLPPLPPLPYVHVYAPAPQVVYQENCAPAAPYYNDGYGRDRVVVTEPAYGYNHYNTNRDYRYNRYDERYNRGRDEYRHRDEYRNHIDHGRRGR